MLVIKDLYAKVKGTNKEIIKGLNLEINENEIHVIMGPMVQVKVLYQMLFLIILNMK